MKAKEIEQRLVELDTDFDVLSASMERNPNPTAKRILKDRLMEICERNRRLRIDLLIARRNEGLLNLSTKSK